MKGQRRNILDHLRVRPITQDEAKKLYGVGTLPAGVSLLNPKLRTIALRASRFFVRMVASIANLCH